MALKNKADVGNDQLNKFKALAKELECDESEPEFVNAVQTVARAKPADASAERKKP